MPAEETRSEEMVLRKVQVQLSSEGILKRVEEMRDSIDKRTELEHERKAVADRYKTRIKALTGEIEELSREIADGLISEEVMCYYVPDYEDGTMKMIRSDTDELVNSRSLRDDEKQLKID